MFKITITMDIIQRPVIYSQRFGGWILSPALGGTYSLGYNRLSSGPEIEPSSVDWV
jgi:hypothetical protein